MNIAMLVMSVLILLLVAIMLPLILRATKRRAERGHAFEPFYFENDELVANLPFSDGTRYHLDEIDHVEFGFQYGRGNWFGTFRVHKKGGKRSRRFSFDGSLYTQKVRFHNSREEIVQVIELLQTELKTRGIPCVMPKGMV